MKKSSNNLKQYFL